MLNLLNMKFILSISLLITFPISNAYYDALRTAKLPKGQHVILGIIALSVKIMAAYFCFTLISQIDENSFSSLNLIPALILFILGILIQKKFPDIFLKVLLKNNIESKNQN